MVCGVLMVGWGVSDWVILVVMLWMMVMMLVMWVTIDLVIVVIVLVPYCGDILWLDIELDYLCWILFV
jgi:hypothetical protein